VKKVNCIHYQLPVCTGRNAYVDGYRVGGKTGAFLGCNAKLV
jgi:hypothetical protein